MIDGCHTEPNNVDPVPTPGPYLPYPKVAHAIPSLGCLPQPQASAWLSGSQLLMPVMLAYSLPYRECLLVQNCVYLSCSSHFMFVPAFLPAFCFSAIQHYLQAIAIHGTMHTR